MTLVTVLKQDKLEFVLRFQMPGVIVRVEALLSSNGVRLRREVESNR